jgi:hypothetical protein
MSEPPEKPSTKPVPMSEWLTLMLGEIDRKDAEARAASDERQRRDTTGGRSEEPGSSFNRP